VRAVVLLLLVGCAAAAVAVAVVVVAVAVVGPAVPAAFLAGVLVGARVSARVCWAQVRAARAAREAAELRRDAAIDAAEQLEGEARRLERHIGWLVARPAVAQRAHRVLVQGATDASV
jgi:hypothetical protein